MRLQELRIFPSIVLLPEKLTPDEVNLFRFRQYRKRFNAAPPNHLPSTMMLQSSGSLDAFVELVALNRGGIIAPKKRFGYDPLV